MTVVVDGEAQLDVELSGRIERLDQLRPAFVNMLFDWQATQYRVFEAEGAFEGGQRWQKLSDKYDHAKQLLHPGAPLLVATGSLRSASVNPQAEITDTSLTLTIDSAYAIYHQSARPRQSNLPRRDFASFTGPQKGRWVRFVRDELVGP